jgi:hypothetical protein
MISVFRDIMVIAVRLMTRSSSPAEIVGTNLPLTLSISVLLRLAPMMGHMRSIILLNHNLIKSERLIYALLAVRKRGRP